MTRDLEWLEKKAIERYPGDEASQLAFCNGYVDRLNHFYFVELCDCKDSYEAGMRLTKELETELQHN